MTDDKATPASERHAELTSRYQGDYDEHVAGCHWLHNNHSYFAGRDDAEPALAAERARADRAEARIAEAVVWDDYRDAHVFGDMGTPYVNGARHAHAAIARILREATA